MQYNLYKINNLFLLNEIEFLYNELKKAAYNTIEMHKKRIDYNYKLASDYLDQLKKPKKEKKKKFTYWNGIN